MPTKDREEGKPNKKSKPNRKQRQAKARAAARAGETLQQFCRRLKIPDDWDYLIFSDGSGSNFSQACGWASVTIDRTTGDRSVRGGGMDSGTVNFAEMMAAMQPLTVIDNREEDRGKDRKGGRRLSIQVHIVTDSQYCRDMGGSDNRMLSKNVGLWAAFDQFLRKGIVLNWHHIVREDCELNSFVDRLSKIMRLMYKNIDMCEQTAKELNRTVYDCNPDDPEEGQP